MVVQPIFIVGRLARSPRAAHQTGVMDGSKGARKVKDLKAPV